jgi:hypothetical protein
MVRARSYRLVTGTSVAMVDTEAVEMNDDQASAGARSAPLPLLHLWKQQLRRRARFHARRQSRSAG